MLQNTDELRGTSMSAAIAEHVTTLHVLDSVTSRTALFGMTEMSKQVARATSTHLV